MANQLVNEHFQLKHQSGKSSVDTQHVPHPFGKYSSFGEPFQAPFCSRKKDRPTTEYFC